MANRSDEQPGDGGADAGADQPRASRTHSLMQALVAGAGFLFLAFALANRQAVEFSWLVGESTRSVGADGELTGGIPLILLLLAAFGLGAVAGVSAAWLLRRRRRDG